MKLGNLSKNLVRFRTNANLSQSSLASALGISRQTISYYETGVREPDLANLIKLASYFNCSIDDLIFGNAELKREDISSLDDLSEIFKNISSDSLIGILENKKKELEYYYEIIPKKLDTLDSMIKILKEEK